MLCCIMKLLYSENNQRRNAKLFTGSISSLPPVPPALRSSWHLKPPRLRCRQQRFFGAEHQALFKLAAHAEVSRSSQQKRAHSELAESTWQRTHTAPPSHACVALAPTGHCPRRTRRPKIRFGGDVTSAQMASLISGKLRSDAAIGGL
ncbi:hypothetical protein WJX77_012645 [Trebouxia sp. C0004]